MQLSTEKSGGMFVTAGSSYSNTIMAYTISKFTRWILEDYTEVDDSVLSNTILQQ